MAHLGIANIGDATLIASGGSALVYRALNADGIDVAVKVLRGMRGPEVRRRFDREQSAAELLTGHPRIIEVLESGLTEAGEPYLIMPLIAGGSLQDELDDTGAFPAGKAIADVRTAADAIHFAHTKGVLHRDIKPGNLLRSADGAVVVTDFGIARVKDAGITSATIGATTPLYAAPEMLTENMASAQSDVYGLGALLYALLAGKPAFSAGNNLWASLDLMRTQMPEPIEGVRPSIMRVIEQAMAKSPADRPPTAALFSAYLGEALDADESWRPPRPAEVTQPLPTAVQGAGTPPNLQPPPSPKVSATPPAIPGRTSSFDRPASRQLSRKTSRRADPRWVGAAAVVLLLVGTAWWGVGRLRSSNTDVVAGPVVDTSIPSPTSLTIPATGTDTSVDSDQQDSANPQATAAPAPIPTADASLTPILGQYFLARVPPTWTLTDKDKDVGYGYRTTYRNGDMYLHIDTTPVERQTSTIPIEASAREVASTIANSSPVIEERFGDRTLWSFTFVNNRGTPAIDIFFEHNGDGYAVTAGSVTDPDGAFAMAQQVALSIKSNP